MGAFNQRKWGKGYPGGKSVDKSTEEYESWECSRGSRRGSLCREGQGRYLRGVGSLECQVLSSQSTQDVPSPPRNPRWGCLYGHWMLNFPLSPARDHLQPASQVLL